MIPDEPRYTNLVGQPIYYVDAVHKAKRRHSGDVRVLCIHHTAGRDSRLFLLDPFLVDPKASPVSAHYLIGQYEDTGSRPRIYKYASETKEQTYTQGFGILGGMSQLNQIAVSFEIEGPPFSVELLTEAAVLVASVRQYWVDAGKDPLIIGHKHVDSRKNDPAFNWDQFMRWVYRS